MWNRTRAWKWEQRVGQVRDKTGQQECAAQPVDIWGEKKGAGLGAGEICSQAIIKHCRHFMVARLLGNPNLASTPPCPIPKDLLPASRRGL
jgi:hypothetical protein